MQAGTTSVTISYTEGSVTKTKAQSITVSNSNNGEIQRNLEAIANTIPNSLTTAFTVNTANIPSDYTVTLYSSNPSVVAVNGLTVSPVSGANGSALITLTATNGIGTPITTTRTVTVGSSNSERDNLLDILNILPPIMYTGRTYTASIPSGMTVNLMASNSNVTIDNNTHVITPSAEGDVTITASSGSTVVSRSYIISANSNNDNRLRSITVATSMQMYVHDEKEFTINYIPSDAPEVSQGYGLNIREGNNTIIEKFDDTKIRALAEGRAVVQVYAIGNPDISDLVEITVLPASDIQGQKLVLSTTELNIQKDGRETLEVRNVPENARVVWRSTGENPQNVNIAEYDREVPINNGVMRFTLIGARAGGPYSVPFVIESEHGDILEFEETNICTVYVYNLITSIRIDQQGGENPDIFTEEETEDGSRILVINYGGNGQSVTKNLQATILAPASATAEAGDIFEWHDDGSGAATVDANGVVTAHRIGKKIFPRCKSIYRYLCIKSTK